MFGHSITINSGNITIKDNKIYVNGKNIADLNDISEKNIYITVNGNAENINVDTCAEIVVKGDAKEIHTHNGSVSIKKGVSGSVTTHNGSVMCGSVGGNISTHNGNIMHG